MRIFRSPYMLTREDAERLCSVLKRTSCDGSRTIRDLERRHHFQRRDINAAADAGIICIEKRQPHTGRPSYFAVLLPDEVNKREAAKLPWRIERPLSLTFREEDFLRLYMCRRGLRGILGIGGSATDAYRQVYGRHRKLKPGSIRSAGARLVHQPWMRAALILDRRLIYCGGRLHWPYDLRNNGREWLSLLRSLNRFGDWPTDLAIIVRNARTYEEAVDGIREAQSVR